MLMTGDKSSNNIVADCSRRSFELVVKAVVKMSGGNPFKYHNISDLICDVGDDFSHLREIFERIWKEMPEIHDYVDLHYKGLCWERQGPLSSEYFEQVDVQEILKKVEDVVKIVVEEEKTWRDKKKKKTGTSASLVPPCLPARWRRRGGVAGLRCPAPGPAPAPASLLVPAGEDTKQEVCLASSNPHDSEAHCYSESTV